MNGDVGCTVVGRKHVVGSTRPEKASTFSHCRNQAKKGQIPQLPSRHKVMLRATIQTRSHHLRLGRLRLLSSAPTVLPEFHFDLVVIGSGPSGQKGAINAAKMGKKVAVIDKASMIGGVCVHTGTIPSKTFREAVLHLIGYRQKAFFGDSYKFTKINVGDIMDRVFSVAQKQTDLIRFQLERNQIVTIPGFGRFLDPNHIEVLSCAPDEGSPQRTHVLKADNVLISVGTKPVRPEPFKHLFDGKRVVDSDQILSHDFVLPKDFIVLGGGVIGIEYASMLNALPGTRTTVIDTRKELLDFVDRDIVGALIYSMRSEGAQFRFGEKLKSIEVDEVKGKVKVLLESGKRITGDCLLYALGRQGYVDQLNLDIAGIKANARGLLEVNESFQTAVPHIYAAGDIIGFPALASTSMEQGRLATHYMFTQDRCEIMDKNVLPYGIYTIPEISIVGKSQKALDEMKVPYEVGIAKFEELAKGQMMQTKEGFLKLIFSQEPPHKLLGVAAIGENSAEIIHIGQAVLALGGSVEYFRSATFNFPTYAEAYRVAALDGLHRLGLN
jgi:NAD(P) transhydrogenase